MQKPKIEHPKFECYKMLEPQVASVYCTYLSDECTLQHLSFYCLLEGTDGRAGMASLFLTDQSVRILTPAMLKLLSHHVNSLLPIYARPRFIRVQKELQMTSTYKQQKTNLVREGYDVMKIQDPLYYLNPGTKTYLPLDQGVYTRIMAGKLPL